MWADSLNADGSRRFDGYWSVVFPMETMLADPEKAGVDALPIVALISFLLGMILAFQSAVPMKRFGAEIFVADLIGLSMLRELGPLMTAILLAGRSGAAEVRSQERPCGPPRSSAAPGLGSTATILSAWPSANWLMRPSLRCTSWVRLRQTVKSHSATCPSTFTLGKIRSTFPSGPTITVVRSVTSGTFSRILEISAPQDAGSPPRREPEGRGSGALAISVASGVDAIFSFLPPHLAPLKVPTELVVVCGLTALNLRGIKVGRVEDFTAVMICRVTHSSANEWKLAWRVGS